MKTHTPTGIGARFCALLVLLATLGCLAGIAHAQSYLRIKNKWTGEYLYASGAMCMYVNPHVNDWASQWEVLGVAGTNPVQSRIKNRETGQYLHVNGGLAYVECGDLNAAWTTQLWLVEDYAGYKRMRSVANTTRFIHTENRKGYAQCGTISDAWSSAQWTFETVTDTSALPRGGSHPWTAYEAESMTTNGTILGPSTMPGNFNYAAESSGRRCVRLDATGEYAQFTATKTANALVVRAAIPDSTVGGGLDGTISLYVNGTHKADLSLTSRHSYIYNYEQTDDTLWSNDPASGEVSRFYFDESRLLLSDLNVAIAVGDVVKLQIDSGDMGSQSGQFCVVDLVELENVAAAGTMPSGFYSIATYGAVADDGLDDTAAIKACISAVAANGGKGVWIPKGTYRQNDNLALENVTLKGAGMWHSRLVHTLVEPYAQRTVHSASITAVTSNSGPARVYDLAISGSAPYDQTQSGAVRGRFGDASVFQNLWIEHQQVGMWLAYWASTGGTNGQTNGLFVSGCRVRNTFADGINLCTSVQNGTVVNCHVRGTEDDAFAQWSNPSGGFYTKNNTFKFCRAQLPLRGNCFALYGGENSRVRECTGADTLTKCGIIASSAFNMTPFVNSEFKGLDLARCGGYLHTPGGYSLYGAIGLLTQLYDVQGVKFSDINVTEPSYYGIHFMDANSSFIISGIEFTNVAVSSPFYHGIKVNSPVDDGGLAGATCDNVDVTGLGLQNSSSTFTITKTGSGNSGW